MISHSIFYVITTAIFGDPDVGPIIGGYIGTIFLCAGFTAVGVFASSVTKNQIIAFFTGFIICIALTMIDTFLISPYFVTINCINKVFTKYSFHI